MPKEQASKGKNKAPAQKGGKAAKGKDTKKKGEKGGKKPKARLTGEAEVTVREIFDHYDLDNNGALDAVEVERVLTRSSSKWPSLLGLGTPFLNAETLFRRLMRTVRVRNYF